MTEARRYGGPGYALRPLRCHLWTVEIRKRRHLREGAAMYATYFANAVGYCWIPNVTGDVTTQEHIEQEADRISRKTDLRVYHEMM